MKPFQPLPLIAIHGGAGTMSRNSISAAQEAAYHAALQGILRSAQQLLANAGSALDAHGNLAAATSTGGMTNKRSGRVGDTPLTAIFGDRQSV